MSLTAVLSASLTAWCPQNIQLPPRPQPVEARAERPKAASDLERFQRDLAELRSSPPQVERALQQMAQDYPDIEQLILARLRPARPRELEELMIAARRFGTPRIADEILFQLLARPVGDATTGMLETMVVLKGPDARKALRDCIQGRIAGVRRVATRILARFADGDDLDFALLLASEQSLDLQLAGVELLAAVPHEQAQQRLCQLLARDPALAGSACAALIGLGPQVAPHLLQILAQPPIDRSYAYAAFALANIDQRAAAPQLTAAAAPALTTMLGGIDPLARALAAVPLADIAYRGLLAKGDDAEIVATLLDVVEPRAFLPNLDLLRTPALARLRQLTGRLAAVDGAGWRDWWAKAEPSFAGLRARLEVGPGNAGVAVVHLDDGSGSPLRLLGEELADVPPLAGTAEYVLTGQQMLDLVGALTAAGFMTHETAPVTTALPATRRLELQVAGARAQVAATTAAATEFDQLVAIVHRVVDAELWQQFRHPTAEPERGAFWRAERRWLAEHPGPAERDRRFAQRVVRVWSLLTDRQRDLGLARLLALSDRKGLLDEADCKQVVELVRAAPSYGKREQTLLELAAASPGDRVWRDCIDAAWRAPGGGREAVDRLFVVLGADRVLAALDDERADVRRAALDEVVQVNDLRAADRLLKMFDDPDLGVRRSAIYAAGQLQLPAARVPLIERIVADDTDPAVRRESLHSLGRIGGEGVFGVLQRALGAPVSEDRDAALRGLGELRDPRAAQQLAEIFAAGIGTSSGEVSRYYLQRMGAKLAVPALRAIQSVQNPAVHRQVVLLLGGYQDPRVIPELVNLLREDFEPLTVGALLAATTGIDVATLADRVGALETWLRAHRTESQWQWLIQALDQAHVAHSLDAAQFVAGAGLKPVPELARLMVEAQLPRLRVLAAAVLRNVTGEEFGQVSFATPQEVREGIAARYRVLYESARAAQNR